MNLLSASAVDAGLIGDIVLLAIILIVCLVTAKKGFARCAVGVLSWLLSIFLAFTFCKVLAQNLQNWFSWLDKLSSFFLSFFEGIEILNVDVSNNVSEDLTETGLPAFVVKYLSSLFTDTSEIPLGTTAAQLLAPYCAQLLLTVISFFIIFIGVKIIAMVLNATLSKAVENIPVVKEVNSILGFIVGIIYSVLFVGIAAFVLTLIPFEFITDFIEQTTLISFIYHNNPLGLLINWSMSSDWVKDFITTVK